MLYRCCLKNWGGLWKETIHISFNMSVFKVENITNKIEGVPISLSRVNEKLVETPRNIQNSNGIIERMIAVA